MALNKYIGWGLSTLGLWLLNKRSNSTNELSAGQAQALRVTANDTKIGSPIPAVMGTCLLKSPIIAYFGDFHSKIYTEEYSAHAKFNAWPLVFELILSYIARPFTGHITVAIGTQSGGGMVTGGQGGKATSVITKVKGTVKEDFAGPLLQALFIWLLNWLINRRHLKTTIQKGFKYYLGYQLILCWSGENLQIKQIYMREKSCWNGTISKQTQNGTPALIKISNYNLFGGPDEQGGFDGTLRIYTGGANQGADSWMAEQMNKGSVQSGLRGLTPAYRPFVSIVVPTAYIGKEASIPITWVEVSNIPSRLGLGAIGEDANPAEVLFELHVNNDWGLGESEDLLDKDSLVAMGKTLEQEGIGISVKLDTKIAAKDLIHNILTHINAIKYIDTSTGKLAFKLVRDDYNPDDCFVLDVSNCSNVQFTRSDWHETVGRINVSFTDRGAKYEEASIPAVDPANMEINRTMTEKSYRFTYFTSSKAAYWAAKRELTEQAYPLATVEITANRTAYGVRIGDVIRLNWRPYGIKNMLMRVTKVDLGDLERGIITINAMEDIWGLNKTDFSYSNSTDWGNELYYPTGVQAYRFMEMPWEITSSLDTYVSAMAARPDEKTETWTVWREPYGGQFSTTTTKDKWTAAGRLVYDIDEFSSVEDIDGIEVADIYGIEDMATSDTVDMSKARSGGQLIVIDDEIMAYSKLLLLPNGHWYIKGIIRGTYDTVPAPHYGQANVFFLQSDRLANVTTGGAVCMRGKKTSESYNITTAIGTQHEKFDIMKVRQLSTTQRAEAPTVPGRIRMSDYNYSNAYHSDNVTGDLSVSFIPRNKFLSIGCVSQDDTVGYFTKLPFTPAEGTDYLMRVTVAGKVIEKTIKKSPFVYSYEERCKDFANMNDATMIEIFARKENLLSYQPQHRTFSWTVATLIACDTSPKKAQTQISTWLGQDRITVPQNDYSAEYQVRYADMPIVVLGRPCDSGEQGALLTHDGKYIKPTGDILIVKKDKLTPYTMKAGYLFASYFIATATGGKHYYQWDGKQLNERSAINAN